MPTTTPLRARAEAEAKALALQLKPFLKEQNTTASAVSRALGRTPQYLTAVFSGRLGLKLKDLFGALALFKPHPQTFFDRLDSGQAVASARGSRGHLAKLDELAARMTRPPYRRSPEETTDRAGQVLAAWVVGAGKKQREISRQLGLGNDALGKALRNETELAAWHVFAVLDAIGKEPGLFFEEVLAAEEPGGLTDEEALVLMRVLEATLEGLKTKTEQPVTAKPSAAMAPPKDPTPTQMAARPPKAPRRPKPSEPKTKPSGKKK